MPGARSSWNPGAKRLTGSLLRALSLKGGGWRRWHSSRACGKPLQRELDVEPSVETIDAFTSRYVMVNLSLKRKLAEGRISISQKWKSLATTPSTVNLLHLVAKRRLPRSILLCSITWPPGALTVRRTARPAWRCGLRKGCGKLKMEFTWRTGFLVEPDFSTNGSGKPGLKLTSMNQA